MEEKYMFGYENENEFKKLESALKKYKAVNVFNYIFVINYFL